ncbi:hypothetical protein ASG66_02150 [Bacillus sp. Leaf406]|nr:hypothetical protein ASG66_02150 [Bacillus sp. Leaf406]
MKNKTYLANYIFIGICFLLGIVFISYGVQVLWILPVIVVLIISGILMKESRKIASVLVMFLFSFYAYVALSDLFKLYTNALELIVLVDRILLLIIILGLLAIAKVMRIPFSMQLQKPKWENRIYFPFITHGFHSIPIRLFYVFSIIGSVVCFSANVFFFGNWGGMKDIVLFAVAFSILNATLEELLWRGSLFQILSRHVSMIYALIVTSLAFGLHHIALGIPFAAALSFSIGGFFFAVVMSRSESVFPSIVWHMIINFLMVLSGFIIPY